MNTKVHFDVHGKDLSELGDRAYEQLAAVGVVDPSGWHLSMQVEPEVQSADGSATVWRGEITATHPSTYRP